MEWLNYHHLYYFWIVAKEGSVSGAARQLHLARPTVTAQIRELEASIGRPLFTRHGRGMILTDFGQQVYRYADDIFSIGHELREFLQTGQADERRRLRVGVPDVVPKVLTFELLRPALLVDNRPRMECYEGNLEQLLSDLQMHRLDLVISDVPAPSSYDADVISHELGESGVSLLGTPELAATYRSGFPESLNTAPVLLPTAQTAVRKSLDRWMDKREIFPELVAELEDSALLNVFGQSGLGLFPVPTVIETRMCHQYRVELVGRLPELLERFYAISIEQRLEHESVSLIVQQAQDTLRVRAPDEGESAG